jgi:hypothetical protein
MPVGFLSGLVSDGAHLFVSDSEAHCLTAYAIDRDFAPVRVMGTKGSGPNELDYWGAVAVCEGFALIADLFNSRVMMFDARRPPSEWKFAEPFGRKGKGPGEFEYLFGLSAADGLVCTLDTRQQCVQLFDATVVGDRDGLRLVPRWSLPVVQPLRACALYVPPGAAPKLFLLVEDQIDISYASLQCVACTSDSKAQVFAPRLPQGYVVVSGGRVYTNGPAQWSVRVFDAETGAALREVETTGRLRVDLFAVIDGEWLLTRDRCTPDCLTVTSLALALAM